MLKTYLHNKYMRSSRCYLTVLEMLTSSPSAGSTCSKISVKRVHRIKSMSRGMFFPNVSSRVTPRNPANGAHSQNPGHGTNSHAIAGDAEEPCNRGAQSESGSRHQ